MNKWCKLSLIFLLSGQWCHAQNVVPNTKEANDYMDATQLWRSTLNPAGLSRDSIANRGVTYAGICHQEGSHYLVQDGDKKNLLCFSSDRYQTVGEHLYAYGRFTFDMRRDFNRSWSDVLRSHNGNPYISGSSIKGKYDFQNIDLTALLATHGTGRFTYGMRIDYKVGDFSRLRDPRSRVMLADYRLVPAVTYAVGKNSVVGLSAHYKRRKEKLGNLTTVQTDANLKYYQGTGMEHMTGSVGAYTSYSREYVDHELGAELSFGFRKGSIESLTSFTFNTANEDMYGANKYMPGKYHRKEFALMSQNRVKTASKLHSLDVKVACRPQSGDEYKQQKLITKDPVTGIESFVWATQIEYPKRYEVSELAVDIRYRLSWLGSEGIVAFAGLHGAYLYDKDEYHLPESFLKVGGADAELEGGLRLVKRKSGSLWMEAMVGYHASVSSTLSLNDATTEYAQSVLLPDMEYYGASWTKGSVVLTYQFPVTIKRNTRQWFVRMHGDYLTTNKKTDRWGVSYSFGVYY